MSATQFKAIEDKLDMLIRRCRGLEKENAALRAKEDVWGQERKRLIEKNDIARKRVEAMIKHLKELETEG